MSPTLWPSPRAAKRQEGSTPEVELLSRLHTYQFNINKASVSTAQRSSVREISIDEKYLAHSPLTNSKHKTPKQPGSLIQLVILETESKGGLRVAR